MTRVVIADDQPLVLAGLQAIFAHADDITVVGEAGNGRAAVDLVRSLEPDVLLTDIRMPLLDGIEATRMIKADATTAAVRVLILTTFDADEYVYAALEAGASGFLLKDAPPERVFDAVRVVAAGEALLAPAATRRLIEAFVQARGHARPDAMRLLAGLTDREREVVALVGRGLSNADISAALVVSEATTKTHVSRAMAKLQARDRAQLVVLAYESGLVHPGGS
ncbi:DNA-binding response regulator, NarL/FixJ family, contains REC and HTH domains [Friedmanniella luteola]|uniref:DNA-binding response regulator, NarL/FixJ family, contains REC and HTH domains n=1 Tax=Friedmanniella luteola TaxID=546871 RepID=A0A1H1VED8_9ACTN|nr:response regulator transcription factor [Friedmanniella luteola]SDS82766.1 DNA-binding response regulator, NarL/FixJ family, contains REC and HTH domains [Friedmanniella luteola]